MPSDWRTIGCPHCGETDENEIGIVADRVQSGIGNDRYWVICSCEATGPIADTKEASIAAWQRRNGGESESWHDSGGQLQPRS